ncbi:MAG: hypothetical protein ABI627_18915 [Polyangiaceae bacterium]
MPFESSVFAAFHAPYLAHLIAQLQPGLTPSDDSFLVLDVNETDESLFAVGRCPRELHLGAIALDDSGRLHALCLESPGIREPLMVHGVYDRQTSSFSWDVPFPVTALDLSFDWVALGPEGGLPVVMDQAANISPRFVSRGPLPRGVQWSRFTGRLPRHETSTSFMRSRAWSRSGPAISECV